MFVSSSFGAVACVGLMLVNSIAQAAPPSHKPKWKSIEYSTVTGFFAQDLPETDPATFDYISSNFGLLDEFKLEAQSLDLHNGYQHGGGDKSRPRWDKFEKAVEKLNKKAPRNVQYKVLFLARHGEGYHNVAESYYGTHLWDCYWSLLDGNATSVWSDAKITKAGVVEAERANAAWKKQIRYGVPIPQAFYSSPLSRAAQTLVITWEDITLNKRRYPKPVLSEKLRETLGIHTCDRRSTKSELQTLFPQFGFSPNFPEADPFWDPIYREPNDARDIRLKSALDDIITSTDATYISFSMHSGSITSLVNVIGHRPFRLQTGGMMPTVVRVEFLGMEEPPVEVSPSQPAPTCTVNPTPAPTAVVL